MLTYQLREHVLKVEGSALPLPGRVEVELTLRPSEALGIVTGRGRTDFLGQTGRLHGKLEFNANTGRHYVTPLEPLRPLEVTDKDEFYELRVEGNKLHIFARCATHEDLVELIESVHYGLPMLMNLDFLDSPVVEQVCGKVGDVSFRWLHNKIAGGGEFDVTTHELQQERVVAAWKRLTSLSNHPAKRRLLAALHYFHTACRLREAGNSPSEFEAEVILNYSKILEVLFQAPGDSETREAARKGLRRLHYSAEEIERDLIPAMSLRSEIDVGHAKLCLLTQGQLNVLHAYTNSAERIFRELLRKLLVSIESGFDVIPVDPPPLPRRETVGVIQKLAEHRGLSGLLTDTPDPNRS